MEKMENLQNKKVGMGEKYNEILKLRKMLLDNNIHHYFSNMYDGYSIIIDELDFFALQNYSTFDTMEIHGSLVKENEREQKIHPLTAEDVFNRIVKGLKKIEKLISLDNGLIFMTSKECMEELRKLDETEFENKWESIVNMMEFDICQQVEDELSPCTEEEFLKRYLQLSKYNLIIG